MLPELRVLYFEDLEVGPQTMSQNVSETLIVKGAQTPSYPVSSEQSNTVIAQAVTMTIVELERGDETMTSRGGFARRR